MRIPRATYRLQLTPDFRLRDAEELLPYLDRLGISDLYLSPAFAAKPGSMHGYDIVDMCEINNEVGGIDAYRSLSHQVNESGMGIIQDIVPNHRAFYGTNRMLMNVLEIGPRSPYYRYYDVIWDHSYKNIRGKLLAPFLGDFYGRCLERGELKYSYGKDGFRVNYYELSFPLTIYSYRHFLRHNLERRISAASRSRDEFSPFLALVSFIERFEAEQLENPTFDFVAFVKDVLWELCGNNETVRRHIDANIAEFNGEEDAEISYDLFDRVMSEQYFRLSYWKVGTEELNYRRFFSINDLIALRVEDRAVFDDTHKLVLSLAQEGHLHGLRIDHVDGLYDPKEYLRRIREELPDCYVVVEKILETDERLPNWAVQGTTGYEFMDRVAGVFADAKSGEALDRVYCNFTGSECDLEELVLVNKRNIIGKHMAGDVDNLALSMKGITNRQRIGNDLTMYAVRRALVEILTHYPVYRTYINSTDYRDEDRDILRGAIENAKETLPLMKIELELIGSFLLGVFDKDAAKEAREEWTAFLMRLQQYTGPLMAKGVEDTTFYVYNRLIARNEVGSSADNLGYSIDEFHQWNRKRLDDWPLTMNSTATHDTKRGEDARMRLVAISENPAAWRDNVLAWHHLNLGHKTKIDGRDCPNRNDEYFVYQAILGSAPFDGFDDDNFPDRLENYLIKSVREGKVESSWLTPNAKYEKALTNFARRIISPEDSSEFLAAFGPYFQKIALAGMANSLGQLALKLTCPGVPDIYQGTDLWDFSFVDPDNRRAVDYARRSEMMDDLLQRVESDRRTFVEELLRSPHDARIKMLLLRELLAARKAQEELFRTGSYEPLAVEGAAAEHIIAFVRRFRERMILVIVARHVSKWLRPDSGLWIDAPEWTETSVDGHFLGGKQLRNTLTGESFTGDRRINVATLLGNMPVAVFTG